jgi:hypothetical protein
VSALEQVDTLLRESCGPVPSPAAWETLVQFVTDNFPDSPPGVLALRINGLLHGLEVSRRETVIDILAQFMRASPWRTDLFNLFGASRWGISKAMALALAVPEDLDERSRRSLLRRLLITRHLPSQIQAQMLARLAAATGRTPQLERLIDAFLGVRSATRRRRRLNRLNLLIQDSATLADRIRQAQASLLIACPRCQVRMGQPAMIRHLLTQHELILEGKRVRNAWRAIDQWLVNYRGTGEKAWLRHCFELVIQLGTPAARRRLQQHMVLQKVAPNAMLRRLLIEARASLTALCPTCLSQVRVQTSRLFQPVSGSHGLISQHRYRVHLRDDTPVPHLTVETPEGQVFSGHEPGRWLTRQGVVLIAALPLAIGAVGLALLGANPALVVTCLVLASTAYGWSWLREHLEPDCASRVIDIAWNMLCPRLLARGPTVLDAEFLVSLALGSVGVGSPAGRAYWLTQLRAERDQAFAEGRASSTQLACLARLTIQDAAVQQVDLAALTASALGRCWKARMPMAFAQQLLDDWRSVLWTRGCMARLRFLLLDQAFGEGWEIGNLRGLRDQAPALASVLELGRVNELMELRWLWSSRATAPWLNIAPSRTCFELALDEVNERSVFDRHPDVLFLETQPDGLAICSSGVYWRHLHFVSVPRQFRITERVADRRRSYTLHVGGETVPVHYDPADLVERLDRWLGFLQEDFKKQARKTRGWMSPESVQFLPPGEFAACPVCQERFVGTPGQIGFKLAAPE